MTSEACATDASMRRVLRADLLDFTADPGFALPNEATGVRWRPSSSKTAASTPCNRPPRLCPQAGSMSPRKTTGVAC